MIRVCSIECRDTYDKSTYGYFVPSVIVGIVPHVDTTQTRVISPEDGLKLGSEYSLPFFEVDLIRGTNMEECFQTLGEIVMEMIKTRKMVVESLVAKKEEKEKKCNIC